MRTIIITIEEMSRTSQSGLSIRFNIISFRPDWRWNVFFEVLIVVRVSKVSFA